MKPLFIPSQQGALFGIYHLPLGEAFDEAILYIPPFAEEMNKSRRMATLQARSFVEYGYAVLLLDLFGTGDSEGEFGEATWQLWLQNIDTAVAWLKQQGAKRVSLWGLRTGALLALDFSCSEHQEVERILCWQPVLNGDTFVTQFLRLRVAAAMMDSNAPREKTSDLKKQLQDGKGLEVAGYWLNPDLINPLMAKRADRLALQGLEQLTIFELVANEEVPVTFATTQFHAQLQQQAVNASVVQAVGDAFWATQEITTAPNLIAVTSERLGYGLNPKTDRPATLLGNV